MFESTLKGVLSIAPNAVCDEDKSVVDEVRARNHELTQRNGQKDQIIKAAVTLIRESGEDLDLVLLLGILSQ
jgi:hypothetical protein